MRGESDRTVERALIARAINGDQAAFAELFTSNRQSVYSLCLRRVRDPELAEDAVQDSFILARRAMPGFDPSRRFFPWLATIALHRAMDIMDHVQPLQPFGFIETSPRQADAPDLATRVVERAELQRALSSLPPSQRRMVWLHDIEGWSYSDLARAEGKTELAMRSLLFRARASMRALLRTLGLIGPAIQSMRRRTATQGQRLVNAASIELAYVGASTIGTLTAAVVVVVVAFSVATVSPSQGSGPVPSSVSVQQSRDAGTQSTDSDNSQSQTTPLSLSAGPVKQTARTRPTRPGGATPPETYVVIEVVGPDGQVLNRNETTISCDEVGELPPEFSAGPVRAVC